MSSEAFHLPPHRGGSGERSEPKGGVRNVPLSLALRARQLPHTWGSP
jgi:hypothetical protein